MSEHDEDAVHAHAPELLVNLSRNPELDAVLLDRGWGRVVAGMWRWVPSLADVPEHPWGEKWDVTTVMFDGTRIMLGMVGDWVHHMYVYDSIADLGREIEALEAVRYEG